jgi:hypothetical protein
VRQYLQGQRQVLRAALCAPNFSKLAGLRDQTENRGAAVKAIQVMEALDPDAGLHGPGGNAPRAPGVVIIVQSTQPQQMAAGAPVPLTIDAHPMPTRQVAHDDDGE